MSKQAKILWLVVVVFLIGAGALLYCYSITKSELKSAQALVMKQMHNKKTAEFLEMLVNQVIKSNQEVDFETRLKLENAVRDLKDEKILSEWQKFVQSKSEVEAQSNVKNLLGVLVEKINE